MRLNCRPQPAPAEETIGLLDLCGRFYHKNRRGEKRANCEVTLRNTEELRRLVCRELHDIEVFLGDQVSFHPETKFVATGCGENERGYVDPKV